MKTSALLVTFLLAGTAAAQHGKQFSFDFHGALDPALTLFGPDTDRCIKQEPNGLRISLGADRKPLNPVGLSPRFVISGDFEIRLAYEILSADRPVKGRGVGVNLYVAVGTPLRQAAGLGRYLRVKEGEVYFVYEASLPTFRVTVLGISGELSPLIGEVIPL